MKTNKLSASLINKSGLLIKIVALRNKRIAKLFYKDMDIN